MNKFATKSPVNRDEKSLKHKGNDYDKQYERKMVSILVRTI